MIQLCHPPPLPSTPTSFPLLPAAAAAADNVPAATLGYAWWAVWGQFFLLCFVGLTAFMASEDANRLRTYLMMMVRAGCRRGCCAAALGVSGANRRPTARPEPPGDAAACRRLAPRISTPPRKQTAHPLPGKPAATSAVDPPPPPPPLSPPKHPLYS